jgi:hypothetical protein
MTSPDLYGYVGIFSEYLLSDDHENMRFNHILESSLDSTSLGCISWSWVLCLVCVDVLYLTGDPRTTLVARSVEYPAWLWQSSHPRSRITCSNHG